MGKMRNDRPVRVFPPAPAGATTLRLPASLERFFIATPPSGFKNAANYLFYNAQYRQNACVCLRRDE